MNEVNETREIVPSFEELVDKALDVVKENLEDFQSLEGVSDEDRPIVEEVARESIEDKVLEVIKAIKDECASIGADTIRNFAKNAHVGVAVAVTAALTPIAGPVVSPLAGEIAGRAAEAAIVAVGDALLETADKAVFSN